jgi:hypothetical protein
MNPRAHRLLYAEGMLEGIRLVSGKAAEAGIAAPIVVVLDGSDSLGGRILRKWESAARSEEVHPLRLTDCTAWLFARSRGDIGAEFSLSEDQIAALDVPPIQQGRVKVVVVTDARVTVFQSVIEQRPRA